MCVLVKIFIIIIYLLPVFVEIKLRNSRDARRMTICVMHPRLCPMCGR